MTKGEAKTREAPDQTEMWNAYGHAMGAATGLEMAMRMALLDAANKHFHDDEAAQADCAKRILSKTFGQTISKFKEVYPGFAADSKFVDMMQIALDSRNHLAHHFLDGRGQALATEEGVNLVEAECRFASAHFQDLEYFIQRLCPVDFKAFFRPDGDAAQAWIANHPLRATVAALKAGEIDPGDALKTWQGGLLEEFRAKQIASSK